jgi:hypothetical protein
MAALIGMMAAVAVSLRLPTAVEGACTSDFNCSLNGRCVNAVCECVDPWDGDSCGVLKVGNAATAPRPNGLMASVWMHLVDWPSVARALVCVWLCGGVCVWLACFAAWCVRATRRTRWWCAVPPVAFFAWLAWLRELHICTHSRCNVFECWCAVRESASGSLVTSSVPAIACHAGARG